MDSNEIVSSKFKYFSNVKDASRLFGAGVTFYLFKNRSSEARVLLPTSKAGGALTFHGKLNEELKLDLEIKGATKPRYI
ncbi:hypothetical protein CFP56_025702 [Quercus suber]|uniref:Uncharacterized protein n=1 Tax=Quercus suber TaxID=58331 RepID=A0AAW0K1P6_QUESU